MSLPDRTWPDKVITKAPIWCSVDLRDGNQALIDPMNLEEKLLFFKTLVEIGFKEIEIGFPSASETTLDRVLICRALIERNLIPDDVTIQVLVQCRPHLIQKTFEAIDGAKNVIVHFYNSTSTLQRKVVFKTDMQGVIDIAVEGAKLVRELTEKEIARTGANIRYEYSPESFSGTEIDNAVLICEKVLRRSARRRKQGDSEPAEHRGDVHAEPSRGSDRIFLPQPQAPRLRHHQPAPAQRSRHRHRRH